ncbi:adhesion G protein-coupled receptor B1-like isoform X1 [Crassostrea virginica]
MSNFQIILVLLNTISGVCGIVCMSDAHCRNLMTVSADEEAYCQFNIFHVGCCHIRKTSHWSDWGAWGPCTATCGYYGRHTRHRTCIGQGSCVGSSSLTATCNSQVCPVDGYLSDWSDWTVCSQTCGWGQQTRSRDCHPPQYGGSLCQKDTTDKKACHIKPCPVDGVLRDWGPWDHCSATCEGHRKRTRACIPPTNGGAPCSGSTTETEKCGTHHCPVDGVLRDWGPWGHCSATCEGHRKRTRACIPPTNGGAPCRGSTTETEQCGTQHCPVDGMLSVWGDWTPCSVTCGSGSRVRSRACIPPQHGGRDCNGLTYDMSTCSLPECPKPSSTQLSTTSSGVSCPTCNERMECTWKAICDVSETCMVRSYPGFNFTTHCTQRDDCDLIKLLAKSHGEIFCCENTTCLHDILGI